MNKTWTKEEIETLRTEYGTKSISRIARKLNRSESAIINKAARLKLGAFTLNGDYVTLNTLVKEFKASSDVWLRNDVPYKKRKRLNKSIRVVRIEDFWKWADKHRNICKFSNVEKNTFGEEPEWVDTARRVNFYSPCKSAKWTDAEIDLLVYIANSGKYTINDAVEILNRTDASIRRKMYDLYLPSLVSKNKHIKYTDSDAAVIEEMILSGCKYEEIAKRLKKSPKGVQNYMYKMYGTQQLDKLREIIKEKHGK